MNLLQRLTGSDSPKLKRPFRALSGYAIQAVGVSEKFQVHCQHYRIPFYAKSNVALTLWVNPGDVDRAEEFVYSFLKPGDTFIDVGANIGCVTAAGSLAVGDAGAVFSVEPHPQTFQYLRRTVALNDCRNVKVFNTALGAETGVVNFSDERRKDDSNCVATNSESGIRVPCTTLSSLVEEQAISRISLLKIDVEGFELHVLKGAVGVFDRIDCIYIEILEHTLQRFQTSKTDVLDLLKSHGFKCNYFKDDRSNVVAVSDRIQLGDLRKELEPVN